MKTLNIEHISKSFNHNRVIDDLSFSVNSGEIFGLLGPNGAGKTTLIRMMLDILKQDSGNISVFGGALNSSAKNRIGYLPEERGLYKKARVTEILIYLAQLKGISKKQALTNAEILLKSIEMYEHRDKKVEELSKGMQQKIQFLAAVIHNPDLIIVDEPFSGLDPVNTRVIKNFLLEQKKAGKTIILSTHMMEQAEAMCDRILMINQGRMVLYDTIDNIRKKYRSNSLLLEFEGKLEEIAGLDHIKKIDKHGSHVEIFLNEGVNMQSLLEELIRRVEIIRFEQAIPPLNDIFIQVMEGGGIE